jgi:hypothetical protein
VLGSGRCCAQQDVHVHILLPLPLPLPPACAYLQLPVARSSSSFLPSGSSDGAAGAGVTECFVEHRILLSHALKFQFAVELTNLHRPELCELSRYSSGL